MESVQELSHHAAGGFVLAARYAAVIGVAAIPDPSLPGSVPAGPEVVSASAQWARRATRVFGCRNADAAVQKLVDGGHRVNLTRDIERVRRARAGGEHDARIAWATNETLQVIEANEDAILAGCLAAYDAAIALELLYAGYVSHFITRERFWRGVDEIAAWMTETCHHWGAYVRGVAIGHAIYGPCYFDHVMPGYVMGDPQATSPYRIAWPTARLPPVPPLEDGEQVVPDALEDGPYQMAASGLVVEGLTQPGPVWQEEFRAARRGAFNRAGEQIGGLLFTLFLCGNAVARGFRVSIVFILLSIYLAYRTEKFHAAISYALAARDAKIHGGFRMLSGHTVRSKDLSPARQRLESYGVHLPDDTEFRVMVLAPTRDVVLWIDGVFLDRPVPLPILPTMWLRSGDPVELTEPHVMPAPDGTPGRRRMVEPEVHQLQHVVAAARRELMTAFTYPALPASFALVALIAALLIYDGSEFGLLIAGVLSPVIVIFGFVALRRALPLVPHAILVHRLAQDATAGELIVCHSGRYDTQSPGRPAAPCTVEVLPRSMRLWRFDGIAAWRS